MCWNWEVSLTFAIVLAAGAFFILMRRRFGLKGFERDPYQALLVLNLAFVQLYEFLMWLVVYPADADLNQCPQANRVFTALVYFHGVIGWGILVPLFCLKTSEGNRDVFRFPFIYGILYFLLGVFDLVYSTFWVEGQYNCATDGKLFLDWNIALSESRLLPNGYDWFLFSVMPFAFYKPLYLGWSIAFWLFMSFALPYERQLRFSDGWDLACSFYSYVSNLFIPYFQLIEPAIHRLGQKVPILFRGASKFYGGLERLRDKLFFFNVAPHQIKEININLPDIPRESKRIPVASSDTIRSTSPLTNDRNRLESSGNTVSTVATETTGKESSDSN